MKRLEKLTRKVRHAIIEAMAEALADDIHHALCLVDFNEDIQVDVEITGDEATVCVYNRQHLERYYPHIEAYLIAWLPTWHDIRLESTYDAHGFADEADYLLWRYGA